MAENGIERGTRGFFERLGFTNVRVHAPVGVNLYGGSYQLGDHARFTSNRFRVDERGITSSTGVRNGNLLPWNWFRDKDEVMAEQYQADRARQARRRDREDVERAERVQNDAAQDRAVLQGVASHFQGVDAGSPEGHLAKFANAIANSGHTEKMDIGARMADYAARLDHNTPYRTQVMEAIYSTRGDLAAMKELDGILRTANNKSGDDHYRFMQGSLDRFIAQHPVSAAAPVAEVERVDGSVPAAQPVTGADTRQPDALFVENRALLNQLIDGDKNGKNDAQTLRALADKFLSAEEASIVKGQIKDGTFLTTEASNRILGAAVNGNLESLKNEIIASPVYLRSASQADVGSVDPKLLAQFEIPKAIPIDRG